MLESAAWYAVRWCCLVAMPRRSRLGRAVELQAGAISTADALSIFVMLPFSAWRMVRQVQA